MFNPSGFSPETSDFSQCLGYSHTHLLMQHLCVPWPWGAWWHLWDCFYHPFNQSGETRTDGWEIAHAGTWDLKRWICVLASSWGWKLEWGSVGEGYPVILWPLWCHEAWGEILDIPAHEWTLGEASPFRGLYESLQGPLSTPPSVTGLGWTSNTW